MLPGQGLSETIRTAYEVVNIGRCGLAAFRYVTDDGRAAVSEVVDVLNRHRWWFLGTFILIAAGAIVAGRLVPKRYTTSAQVWLDCRADVAVAGRSGDCGGIDRRNDRRAETALLASSKIAARVIDRLDAGAREAIVDNVSLLGNADPGTALLANVRVQTVEGSNIATLTYRDTDPARAAEVTNLIVATYVTDRQRTGARAGRIELARGNAADALDMADRAAATAMTYRAANPAGNDDPELLRRAAGASDVQRADRPVRGVALAGETTNASSANELRTLRTQLAQLNASRTKLQERYGPLHPDMISMNARIAGLIDQISVVTNRVQGERDALRQARARIAEERAAAARRQEIQARLDNAVTLTALRYRQALQDLREAETRPVRSDAHGLTTARLVSASPGLGPSAVVVLSLLAALVGAGCVVVVREFGGSGFRSRKAAARKLGLPVIGMVPEAPQGTASGDVADLILSDMASDFVTAFREINRRLEIGVRDDGPRVMAVTSAFEAEGKTTVSIGIARLAALAGLRVLLIDCDVRRPAATRAIAPDATACLADVVAGTVDLAHASVRDKASGAWVLGSRLAGATGPIARELVGTEAMRALIERAKADYQLVVLDMAPVLALAETRLAAGFAERVVLVARWQSTPIKATRLALDLLKEAEAPAVALVLTRVAT